MDQMEAAGLPGAGLPGAVTVGGTALPLVGRARVYACGITPYDVTHVGHAASFVWIDTLARVLRDARRRGDHLPQRHRRGRRAAGRRRPGGLAV